MSSSQENVSSVNQSNFNKISLFDEFRNYSCQKVDSSQSLTILHQFIKIRQFRADASN